MKASPLTITGGTVCRLSHPLGIDRTPSFGWRCEGEGNNRAMTAWQIVVASSAHQASAHTGDLWDSGKRAGGLPCDIGYEGSPLCSKTVYFWRVRVWDERDIPSEWSEIYTFETGILPHDAWQARWIGSNVRSTPQLFPLDGAQWIWNTANAPRDAIAAGKLYFRKTVRVDASRRLKKAQFGFTADKQARLYCNGALAGTCSAWQSGCLVSLLDYLQPGDNLLAVEGNNLFEGYAGFAGKLVLEYEDGQTQVLLTDPSWKTSPQAGDGWMLPGYDDASWGRPDQALPFGCSPWEEAAVHTAPVEPAPAPVFRREFTLNGDIARARVYVCGLGLFTLSVNGRQPDDTVLNPAHTQYDKRVFYRVFDVTGLLRQGANALSVELGNSFFNETIAVWNWPNAAWRDYPKCLMEVTVWYRDGRSETVGTDAAWKLLRDGPTRFDSIYYGETVDARKLPVGCDLPGFDDTGWEPALEVPAPAGRLAFQCMEPMRRIERFSGRIRQIGESSWVVEAPVMMTGWAALRFDAPAGTEITICYGERLLEDGSVEALGVRQSDWYARDIQRDRYFCRGGGEWFEPHFSYKGFRYLQIDGYAGPLSDSDVKLYLIHNDIDRCGGFESSIEQFNRLHDIMVRTMRNNFQSKPTDTPVWEKNGWTGDANVACESMCCNFDVSLFLSKFLDDLTDAQDSSGTVPQIAPTANWAMDNTPVWNSILILAAEKLLDQYGTHRLVQRHYAAMQRLMALTLSQIEENGWTWYDHQLADWVSPAGGSDPMIASEASSSEGSGICATGFVVRSLEAMLRFAKARGDDAAASLYAGSLDQIRAAFQQKYYDPEAGCYRTGFWQPLGQRTPFRQTSQLVPLAFGLAPAELAGQVASRLAEDIVEKGCHLDTGMVGTKLILPVLCDYGYEDLALRLLMQDTYPSWGYWLACGSTSTWEVYERVTRSEDHYFLGTYDEWFFRYLCGLRSVQQGGRELTIRPLPIAGQWARARVKTAVGLVSSGWDARDGRIRFELAIPIGARARVILPVCAPPEMLDGPCVPFHPCEGGWQAELGSGRYVLEADGKAISLPSPSTEGASPSTSGGNPGA